MDLTTMQRPETHHLRAIPAAHAIREALAAGVPAARMMLSTDSGVPYPKVDASGKVVGLYMAGPMPSGDHPGIGAGGVLVGSGSSLRDGSHGKPPRP